MGKNKSSIFNNLLLLVWLFVFGCGKTQTEDQLEGEIKEYYENGNLKGVVHYSNGRRNGISKVFYQNGNLKQFYFHNNDTSQYAKNYDSLRNLIAYKFICTLEKRISNDTLFLKGSFPISNLEKNYTGLLITNKKDFPIMDTLYRNYSLGLSHEISFPKVEKIFSMYDTLNVMLFEMDSSFTSIEARGKFLLTENSDEKQVLLVDWLPN